MDSRDALRQIAPVSERPDQGAAALLAAVAANLRGLREEAGISLGELARRAGIAKSTVSQLEAGTGNPSVETLWALAVALGVPFGRLVRERTDEVHVVRAGDGVRIEAHLARRFVARLIDSTSRRSMRDLYVLEIEPGSVRRAEPHLPGTVEHLIVTAGRLRAGPGEETVELGPGDYGRFPGDGRHQYEALEPGTRAVLIMEHV